MEERTPLARANVLLSPSAHEVLQSTQQARVMSADAPIGGEIRRGDSFRVERGELPALTVKMIEDLAARLRASDGHWRIELDLQDGAFQVGWRHDRFTMRDLRTFDEDAGVMPTAS